MLSAYTVEGQKLVGLGSVTAAVWIDLFQPSPEDIAAVAAFGVDVPSLNEMEEIEISNRLYREGGTEYLTVFLPGQDEVGEQVMGPVCFVLTDSVLLTIRHHHPRPFETFPERAGKSVAGTGSSARVFLGLVEEVIGRLADHLETAGRGLDEVARQIYQPKEKAVPASYFKALVKLGSEGERISRVRLALLTLGRALTYVEGSLAQRVGSEGLQPIIKGQSHDVAAMEVHADFLSSRLGLASDATLGMINLEQNITVRIVSVVAALFLPPTLIASIYGMNFQAMPELTQAYGYPLALVAMLGSAVLTWAYFKWRGWL